VRVQSYFEGSTVFAQVLVAIQASHRVCLGSRETLKRGHIREVQSHSGRVKTVVHQEDRSRRCLCVDLLGPLLPHANIDRLSSLGLVSIALLARIGRDRNSLSRRREQISYGTEHTITVIVTDPSVLHTRFAGPCLVHCNYLLVGDNRPVSQ
jgi:hypothetical protein